jgi:excisionase family DNA binding protein
MIKMATFNGEFYTVTDAAKYLGFSEHTVRTYLLTGSLRGQKIGQNWLVSQAECDRYKKSRKPRGNPNFKKKKKR